MKLAVTKNVNDRKDKWNYVNTDNKGINSSLIEKTKTYWLARRWWSSSLYGSITSPLTPWRRTAILARSRTQVILGRQSFSHLFITRTESG